MNCPPVAGRDAAGCLLPCRLGPHVGIYKMGGRRRETVFSCCIYHLSLGKDMQRTQGKGKGKKAHGKYVSKQRQFPLQLRQDRRTEIMSSSITKAVSAR